MYIVYIMIIHHVLTKVFSFNSGIILSSSFSDALPLENVFVIRLNIERDWLVFWVQHHRSRGWLVVLELNGPLTQYFTLYQAVFQREREKEKRNERREKNVLITFHPHLLHAQ